MSWMDWVLLALVALCGPCVVRGGRGKTADAPAVLAAAGAAAAVPGKRNKKQGPQATSS